MNPETNSLLTIFLIAVIARAGAQSINVTITRAPSSEATLGAVTSYTLTCTASPNPTNVTWVSPPAGSVGSLVTSGTTSSRTLTLSSPVQLSYVGLYVCNASANGVSRTASYAFNVSAQGTLPAVGSQLYGSVGTSLSTNCSMSLNFQSSILLDIRWIGPDGRLVPSTGRISVANVSSNLAVSTAYLYTRILSFSTLSSQDNNTMYQCLVGTLYTPYFTQYTSKNFTIVVNALTLSPTITNSCQQGVLQLNCTAPKPLSVVPPLMFSWWRSSGGNGTFSALSSGVPGISVSSGSITSTLTITGSSAEGYYDYQCKASLDIPDDAPIVAYVTTGVMNYSITGVVSGLALQSYGQLLRIVWEAPVVNCNTAPYYTVVMTTYSDGALIEMGNTTAQNYTLTKNYTAGVPYITTVWALFGAKVGGNASKTLFTQELAPSANISLSLKYNGSTILVSWEPLSPVEARGFVRYYLVTWSPTTSKARGSTGTVNLTADITMYLITGLDPMQSYTVSVSAGTGGGLGLVSTAINTATFPPSSQPSVSSSPSFSLRTTCGISYMDCLLPIVVSVPAVIFAFIVLFSAILIKFFRGKSQPNQKNDHPEQYQNSPTSTPSPLPTSALPAAASVNIRDPYLFSLSTLSNAAASVNVKDFAAHVNQMHQDRNKMFSKEFQVILNCQHPTETAALPCNKGKNRFHNISPYDHNRVLLRMIEGVEGSDYINASFIDINCDGYKKTHAYIMAQGPMPNTVGDFWRMVFEHKLDTIVMLTQCNEGGKRKCEQYWPDNIKDAIEPFHGLKVTLEEATPFADYVIRKMTVECSYTKLTVSQYQYLGWPEFGTPSSATSLVGFIQRIHSEHNQSGPPMVVHCSSGAGRSGVFIILDCMLEQLKVKDTLNVCEYFADIRRQRSLAVETLAQYVFIHDALSDVIGCGDTRITATDLTNQQWSTDEKRLSKFEEQFELLERFSYKPMDRDISEARQQYNSEKNRYEDRVSFSLNRARLRSTGVLGSDYINASFVNGYRLRNAYIAAQAPLQNTVEDFWRMVWEFKCMNIVMLCRLDEDRVVQYWPMRAGETRVYGKMSVTLTGNPDISGKDQIAIFKLELKDCKSPDQECICTNLFYYTGWPEDSTPTSNAPVLTMAAKTQPICAENKCITVVCNDGMGRTGTFITIHAMMERLKTEHVVDFFQFIKSSRAHRQNFVRTLEQYIFCHDTLAEYMDSMQQYENLKPHQVINSTLV